MPSIIIVGAGVFGASTALHLIRKHPSLTITLIDRDAYDAPTRVAASWDWNKVIRADYADAFYARMGLEARELWRADPVWKRFYHESGVVWISPTDFGRKAIANFEALNDGVDTADLVSVEEAKTLWGGVFEGADYTCIREVFVNRGSGWAEAKEALRSTIEAAVALGVRYVAAEVAEIYMDEKGGEDTGRQKRCRGVRLSNGSVMAAGRVLLCTGAYTPKLLANSAPEWKDLHAGGRILAYGVTEGTLPLNEEQRQVLDTMPVGINDNPLDRGVDTGCLPLPKQGEMKFWGQTMFRNTTEHPLAQESFSMPPEHPNYNQWDVPAELKDDVRHAVKSIFREGRFDTELTNFRICWDASTPDLDFIISPHSACKELFIATCGSFHGFKFLPVLGKYVVEMLDGELDVAAQKKWAWDREMPSTEGNKKWPLKELKDFK